MKQTSHPLARTALALSFALAAGCAFAQTGNTSSPNSTQNRDVGNTAGAGTAMTPNSNGAAADTTRSGNSSSDASRGMNNGQTAIGTPPATGSTGAMDSNSAGGSTGTMGSNRGNSDMNSTGSNPGKRDTNRGTMSSDNGTSSTSGTTMRDNTRAPRRDRN